MHEDPFSFSVLASGSFVIAVFLAFPLEVLLPTRLYRRWIIPLLFVPSILFSTIWGILCYNGMQVLVLSDAHVLWASLNDASVVLRLVFFFCIVLFFCVGTAFMISAHNRYMTDKVLRHYAYATIPVMGTYVCIIYFGLSKEFYMLHVYYMICFNAYITFLIMTSYDMMQYGQKTTVAPLDLEKCNQEEYEKRKCEQQLLNALDEMMETQKLYRSSELTLPELARLLGTDGVKLSKTIRSKGYSNFPAYLNSYRMEEFLHIMTSCEVDKIADAASQAGFRSRAALYRCFMSVYGLSPIEYLKFQSLK